MKFIGREKELKRLSDALHRPYGSVVALYGRRRVGKSALIAKALEGFPGTVISFWHWTGQVTKRTSNY